MYNVTIYMMTPYVVLLLSYILLQVFIKYILYNIFHLIQPFVGDAHRVHVSKTKSPEERRQILPWPEWLPEELWPSDSAFESSFLPGSHLYLPPIGHPDCSSHSAGPPPSLVSSLWTGLWEACLGRCQIYSAWGLAVWGQSLVGWRGSHDHCGKEQVGLKWRKQSADRLSIWRGVGLNRGFELRTQSCRSRQVWCSGAMRTSSHRQEGHPV